MNNDIARMRCPVCGTQTGARINKNGIIYANCPMGHQAKLNKPDSHAAKVALDAGQSWNNGVVYIYPNKQETERKQENDRTNNPTGTNGTIGNNTTGTNYRRTDGQPTANKSPDTGNDDGDDDGDAFGFGLI